MSVWANMKPIEDDEIPCQNTEDILSCPWCGSRSDVQGCSTCESMVCFICAGGDWICPDCLAALRAQQRAKDEVYPDEMRVRRQEESEIAALGRED